MGLRKKHHYIPRFYLKRFSINSNGKTIALYNHKNQRFVENAQIKHQACEDFLYGNDDEVETELSKLESAMSIMFHYWIEEKIFIPPPKNSNAFRLLQRFILYQLFRTVNAGKRFEEAMTQALQAVVQVYYPDKIDEIKGGKVTHKYSTLLSLLYAVDKIELLDFLDCRFVINLTDLPFITSDTPIARYNQLMESIGLYTGATAIAIKGLQIFYPIHPRIMLCLYDTKVYRCGKNSKNCVSTESIEDVHQLNALQYLNSDSQLFFDETVSQEYVSLLIEDFEFKRKRMGPVNSLTETNDKTHLYFMSNEDAKINLQLTFFQTLKDAKNFEHEIAPLRHPSLNKKHHKDS